MKVFFTKVKAFLSRIKGKYLKFEEIFFNFLKNYMWIIVMAIAIAVSTIAKVYAFPFLSSDYHNFLCGWMLKYKELGVHDGFGASLGDYTPFYNYFLCLFGVWFPEEGFVYAIKIFNIIFELSFSTAVFLIVQKCFHKLNYSALAFSISLIIPSIIINGAFWGQCDIVFSSFVVWSFYFILGKKYNLAMIFFSIAFSIKLQAIFFFPFIFLLILKREIKIYHLLYIPIIYIGLAIPSLICGRPFGDIMSVYLTQTQEYNDRLSLSAPSVYAFFNNAFTTTFSYVPVIIFFVITLSYVFYLYYKDMELNKENLITIALISILFSAYFLPHMHERYFFLADLFAFIYLFIKKKGFALCVLINLASITCCTRFLFGGLGDSNMWPGFDPIRVGALFNLVAIVLLTIEMVKMPSKKIDDTITCN